MPRRWKFTVCGERPSLFATCRFVIPRPTSRAISHSRLLSADNLAGPVAFGSDTVSRAGLGRFGFP